MIRHVARSTSRTLGRRIFRREWCNTVRTVTSTVSHVLSVIYGAPSWAGYHHFCVLFEPTRYLKRPVKKGKASVFLVLALGYCTTVVMAPPRVSQA
jgi:hypothetical protein